MDPEKTAAFELGSGDDAFLLLHGFTGSPWEMRPLGEALAARGYFVRCIRLPGHGATPEALAQVTHRDWEQAAEEALLRLSGFRRVFVAGLSMGSLLAISLAARHQAKVHGLALLAPPIRFRRLHLRLLQRARRWPLLAILKPLVGKQDTDIEDPAERAQAPVLPAIPSARLSDLWEVQAKAVRDIPLVRSPALIAVSRRDHVVDPEGAARLARGLVSSPMVRLVHLERGFHIIPRDLGREALLAELLPFFDRIRG